MKLLNTIICYNNAEEVVSYTKSMLELEGEHLYFAITVNACTEKDRDALEGLLASSEAGKVNVYDPGENLGYLNGMLYGYNQYIRKYDRPDYIIMSNTDIRIQDRLFFSKLMGRNYAKEIGCIGPSVYVPLRRTYDNPSSVERRSRESINRLLFYMSIPLVRGLYVRLSDVKGRITKRHKRKESGYVYEVHGCYFILTDAFIRKIADRRYGALMYSEEAYIGENIIIYHFKTYYDADIEVEHMEHSVTGTLKSERIAKYIGETMRMIRDEYY